MGAAGPSGWSPGCLGSSGRGHPVGAGVAGLAWPPHHGEVGQLLGWVEMACQGWPHPPSAPSHGWCCSLPSDRW